jgi:RHS repeat-associated protein
MDDPTTAGVTEGFGLMFYNARWYDPYLNHMTQPDSIVPDPYNSQDYDRYTYARNNPIKYTDPSGHRSCNTQQANTGDESCDQNSHKVDMWGAKTFPKIRFSSNVKEEQEFTFYYALTLAWGNNPDAYATLDAKELTIGWNETPNSETFGSCKYDTRCEIKVDTTKSFSLALEGSDTGYSSNTGQIAVEFGHELVHATSPHRENSKYEEVKAFQQAESLRVDLLSKGWSNLEAGYDFSALSGDINSTSMDNFLRKNKLWGDYGHLPYIPYR